MEQIRTITVISIIKHLVAMTQVPLTTLSDYIEASQKRSARKAVWKRHAKASKPTAPKEDGLLSLSTIKFDSSHEIGIDIIDNKHRLIMLIYNKLVDDFKSAPINRTSSNTIVERLGLLVRLLGEHFADEERVMLAQNYPKLFYHKCEHDNFMVKLFERLDKIEIGSSNYEQLIYFIGTWISGHLMISDGYFGEFYKSRKNLKADAEGQNGRL